MSELSIEQRLEVLQLAIADTENELRSIWFEVTWQGLAWKRREDGGPFTIFFNERPLRESSLAIRLENFSKLPNLVENAHKRADEKLKEYGL